MKTPDPQSPSPSASLIEIEESPKKQKGTKMPLNQQMNEISKLNIL
jgi:hypothetical protein